jgi:hypothetical protein
MVAKTLKLPIHTTIKLYTTPAVPPLLRPWAKRTRMASHVMRIVQLKPRIDKNPKLRYRCKSVSYSSLRVAMMDTYAKNLLLSHTLQLIFVMIVDGRASSRVWFRGCRDFDVLVGLDSGVVAHFEAGTCTASHDGCLCKWCSTVSTRDCDGGKEKKKKKERWNYWGMRERGNSSEERKED